MKKSKSKDRLDDSRHRKTKVFKQKNVKSRRQTFRNMSNDVKTNTDDVYNYDVETFEKFNN
jgi:hypothetical protein